MVIPPNYYPTGVRNYKFEFQKPFTIGWRFDIRRTKFDQREVAGLASKIARRAFVRPRFFCLLVQFQPDFSWK
jgi:hypothetical protein